MSVQTSYGMEIDVAVAGMPADIAPKDVISRSVETAAGADFAIAVSRGTDKDKQCVIGGSDFLGISMRSIDREGEADGTVKYLQKSTAAILRDGSLWVPCPTGCVPGDAVNYVIATGVIDSGAAVAGEMALDGAYWDSTAAAGALAKLVIERTDTTAGS